MGMIPDELFLAYGLDPAADIAKFGDGLIHDTYLYVLGEVKTGHTTIESSCF